jgi:hypothetical protein
LKGSPGIRGGQELLDFPRSHFVDSMELAERGIGRSALGGDGVTLDRICLDPPYSLRKVFTING